MDWDRVEKNAPMFESRREYGETPHEQRVEVLRVCRERLSGVVHVLPELWARSKRGGNKALNAAGFGSPAGKGGSGAGAMDQAIPLSVPGQVHRLIQEATSDENLAQMYIGWMPWL